MTTPAQDAPLVFPSVAFRPVPLSAFCAALTIATIFAAQRMGQILFGVFVGVGLALGLINALLVRRSVASITAGDHPQKSKMALNSAARLLVITVVALTIATMFVHQGGLGVVVGLAVFQVILVLSTLVPVVKKLRTQGPLAEAGPGRTEGTTLDD